MFFFYIGKANVMNVSTVFSPLNQTKLWRSLIGENENGVAVVVIVVIYVVRYFCVCMSVCVCVVCACVRDSTPR